ncbi:NapC/NirT family cytochrome c [Peptococcaceae bacterium 1198_IL3148]
MKRKILKTLLILSTLAVLAIFAIKIPFISHQLDGPKFCGSCHLMKPWVDTYIQSSHSEWATCGGCHIPHNVVSGAFYKAFTGTRDGIYMLIGHVPDRIRISGHGAKVVNDNCLSCHQDVMSTVGYPLADRNKNCFDCHRDLPHNRQGLQKGGQPN